MAADKGIKASASLQARIKKMMQSDEDVGKVAKASPVLIGARKAGDAGRAVHGGAERHGAGEHVLRMLPLPHCRSATCHEFGTRLTFPPLVPCLRCSQGAGCLPAEHGGWGSPSGRGQGRTHADAFAHVSVNLS